MRQRLKRMKRRMLLSSRYLPLHYHFCVINSLPNNSANAISFDLFFRTFPSLAEYVCPAAASRSASTTNAWYGRSRRWRRFCPTTSHGGYGNGWNACYACYVTIWHATHGFILMHRHSIPVVNTTLWWKLELNSTGFFVDLGFLFLSKSWVSF